MTHGYKNPVPSMHRLHILLQGIKRKLGAVGKRKLSFLITIHILKQIQRYITFNYPNKTDRTMLWAASTLAFFAFLRSSEYTAPASTKYKKSCTLQQKDITILDTRMLVQIKGSITDPFREGVTLSIRKTEASICPVAAMQAYLDRKPNRRCPLFRTSTGKFLTCGMMCKLVKETLRFNNLSTDRYSTHSFQLDAATTAAAAAAAAAAAGIPDSKIKILGRWSSSVYHRYVLMSLNVLQGIPKAMAYVSTLSQIWVPY